MVSNFPKSKPNSEWRTLLSPSQYAILREKATERPYTDPTLSSASTTPSVGTYHCAACDTPLYNSSTKFNSGCGWPSFYQALPGALVLYEDHSHGMERIEMCCAGCDGHLGHIFKGEGYGNPVDERHCVNSISLKFVEEPVPVSKKL
ncbi:hypothetical protein WICPIJ_004659 [Wickerhamomyces pijperi]|uniref:Peptide-methionine (R)-S-oxide reductase n=1 Tax=Wickerhamomyces pijperi TaxID=599730 RepID=A0A9P8Q5B6_WICPI|nr:hypothetical protein WICPIJ_004659 [Wickerhamomyces pijperi]